MAKKASKFQIAQQKVKDTVEKTNQEINKLGEYANELYISLNTIQSSFDQIRNVPKENLLKYERLKGIKVNWQQQCEKIESDYKKIKVQTAGQAVAGVGAGVAVAALGPTAAMGIATTFGVASTGTAISALSGAAATNAALAWLGGGALAAGGGGMAAGSAFLSLAGPVGWTIVFISIAASSLAYIKSKKNKKRLENIYTLICNRDAKLYEQAADELNERITRILDEAEKLNKAIAKIETFGTDYAKMTEEQQYELGAYVNLMEASTMLLIQPISGLQPKYSEQDYEKLCADESDLDVLSYLKTNKTLIVSMANLLYEIKLNDKDKKLLVKSLKKNGEFLSSVQMTKKELHTNDIIMVERALDHKDKTGT